MSLTWLRYQNLCNTRCLNFPQKSDLKCRFLFRWGLTISLRPCFQCQNKPFSCIILHRLHAEYKHRPWFVCFLCVSFEFEVRWPTKMSLVRDWGGGCFALRWCGPTLCEQCVNASYCDMTFCVSAVAGRLLAGLRITFFRICSLLVIFGGTRYLIVHTSIKKEE